MVSKQITMAAGSGKDKNQVIIFNAVDQEPIVSDMTFPVPFPIAD
jgi:hypothetical protein